MAYANNANNRAMHAQPDHLGASHFIEHFNIGVVHPCHKRDANIAMCLRLARAQSALT